MIGVPAEFGQRTGSKRGEYRRCIDKAAAVNGLNAVCAVAEMYLFVPVQCIYRTVQVSVRLRAGIFSASMQFKPEFKYTYKKYHSSTKIEKNCSLR